MLTMKKISMRLAVLFLLLLVITVMALSSKQLRSIIPPDLRRPEPPQAAIASTLSSLSPHSQATQIISSTAVQSDSTDPLPYQLFIPLVMNTTPVQPNQLSPEVEAHIAGTFLTHAASYPDPNETVATIDLYLAGLPLLKSGQTEAAWQHFDAAVTLYPESRYLWEGLASAWQQRYEASQSLKDLRAAVEAFITADELGLTYGRVHYTYRVGQGLGRLKDIKGMQIYFDQALQDEDHAYLTTLDYARGLSLAESPAAEDLYKQALVLEPADLADAEAYYAEWLLDQDRPLEVISLITEGLQLDYAHFLKGVALERLGKVEAAQAAYQRYELVNSVFPAPARFRIQNSRAQTRLNFEGGTQLRASSSKAISDLSQLIACEAGGESKGGKRAVGWTVRTRVFRAYHVPTMCGGYGSNINGPWKAASPDASLPDKYMSIMNHSQFYLPPDCKVGTTPETDYAATQVYYGTAPDPVSCWCPAGQKYGSDCNGNCSAISGGGAHPSGPAWFGSTSCGGDGPAGTSCNTLAGKICGNGGSDNCFWRIKN